MLRKLVEININIVRRLFVDVQSNRKRHKEISMARWTTSGWLFFIPWFFSYGEETAEIGGFLRIEPGELQNSRSTPKPP